MATVSQRLTKLEDRIGGAEPGRVIFMTGGEATEADCDGFLASKGIRPTPHDMVFQTIYETAPESAEPPMPLRITCMTTFDGRPLLAG